MKVSELMHSPVTVSYLDTIPDAARLMRDRNVGCLVVTAMTEPVGIITDRDITIRCAAAGHDPFACKVEIHMTKPLIAVRPDTDALEAVHLMVAGEVKRLPVMEDGKLVGVVSLSDIAEALEMPMQELLAGMGGARRTGSPVLAG